MCNFLETAEMRGKKTEEQGIQPRVQKRKRSEAPVEELASDDETRSRALELEAEEKSELEGDSYEDNSQSQ